MISEISSQVGSYGPPQLRQFAACSFCPCDSSTLALLSKIENALQWSLLSRRSTRFRRASGGYYQRLLLFLLLHAILLSCALLLPDRGGYWLLSPYLGGTACGPRLSYQKCHNPGYSFEHPGKRMRLEYPESEQGLGDQRGEPKAC
ncbi:uncharacterized protein BO95DRAFT_21813 [Aspergillus brunneoviolaceus CBS 621.78]|uniref:Uncharacterized protein n=1 Tax=Aspergillus brunneoviolaceus CBS 621.78 TaxID=1450534 RepID=A0ACD1FTB1_9EURO|nr:hypothetical protein BO95DRAFT_21813 [Aspergillus brunneoviolaceus CBS 621.78]RAH40204.1 hypothetical protein BO95DRAFT_21813 [Aspergillus brunneoviolaceus CBS 621.78]